AARPAWSPDGQSIVYLRLLRDVPGVVPTPPYSVPETVPALVRRVTLSGGEPETLSGPPRIIGSVFYLSDGRLAWTMIELAVELDGVWWGRTSATTRIEVMSPEGTVSTLRTLTGYAAPAVPSPWGDGLYCRRYRPLIPWHRRPPEDLLFLPLPDGAERNVVRLARPRGWTPRFAVAADNKALYVGQAGRLWKIALPSGAREPIAFSARVKLEIQDPLLPRRLSLTPVGSSAPPRSVMHPRLSPDGRSLVFMAARYLWRQPLGGGQAQRLFEGRGLESESAFSPDGRQFAFVHAEYGRRELRVFDFETRQTHTLTSGLSGLWQPSWSPDSQRLVFMELNRAMMVNVSDWKKDELPVPKGWSAGRPHFSPDGQSLYFTTNGTLFRMPLQNKTKPEPISRLASQLNSGLVSPDGKWLAFQRKLGIWVAALGGEPVGEEHIRRLSLEGGDTFAFTPDSSAVIYAAGNRVWRHPLAGGEREEIPIRLELERPTPPPLLVRRVRLLAFDAGGFGPETSLFIEQGRIVWVGSERGRQLPRETINLDAGGRFAIPGLFDLHLHQTWSHPEVFLAYGVTSVRDLGSGLSWMNTLADRTEATSEPLPRYFFSGSTFSPWLIHNNDDAQTYVRRWKEWGGQIVKVYPPLSWSLQRAVAEEARQQGLPVIGHGTDIEEITKSVTLGYLTLEHTPSPPPYDDVLKMFAAAGTRWVPTLAIYGGNALLLREEPERLEDAKLRAFTPERGILDAKRGGIWNPLGDNELRGQWRWELAAIHAAHRRGVKLQVGSDANYLGTGVLLGASLHWELEYFVQAGIPPLEVLRIATQQAAEAVGADDDLGTVEPGKLADIVLLDANPLEDIKNTQTIWRVIKGGWVFDPEELQPAASTSSAPD
ncbi:MAG: amidohydrolase family protein, partial [Gemmatimonadales bacterium]